jgi:hypothetical protein
VTDVVRARLDDIAGLVWKPDPVAGPRVQVRLLSNPDAAAMHRALVEVLDLTELYAIRAARIGQEARAAETVGESSALEMRAYFLALVAQAVRSTVAGALADEPENAP